MHTTIKRVVKAEYTGNKCWITTIEFEDGGELLTATGVGKGYTVGTPVIVYMDDRYNRLKFSIDNRAPHNSATIVV